MGTILGISTVVILAAIGGYVAHIFLPLSRLWDWAKALLGKVGIKFG